MRAKGTYAESRWAMICVLLILAYLSPYLILGEQSHIRVHDNLDSNVAVFKVIAEDPGMFWSMKPVQNMMNGLPRASLPSEFNLFPILIFFLKDTFTAYVLTRFIIHLAAFAGMLLLLRNHIVKESEPAIRYGVALCFSLIPFWPTGGLSIAGLPLVLNSFLNIRSGRSGWPDWVILALVPFYSFFLLSYMFLIPMLWALWLFDCVRAKKINTKFFFALVLFASVFVFIDFRLFHQVIFGNSFVSHRTEFSRIVTAYASYPVSKNFLDTIFVNHDPSRTFPTYQKLIIIPVIITACAIAAVKGFKTDLKRLAIIFFLVIVLAALYSLYYWPPYILFVEHFKLLNMINYSRVTFLLSIIWYIGLAFALLCIMKIKFGKPIATGIIVLQVGYLFYNAPEFAERRASEPSYKEFYSSGLFEKVAASIGKDRKDYRVVSIGIHPSVALYNGFYNLDAYTVNYPLSYKHAFRKVIENELVQNQKIREYFDFWGSRCYVFTSERPLAYWEIFWKKDLKLNKLELNADALRSIGGNYILSAMEIVNFRENGLKFQQVFDDERSPFRIYLYKVIEEPAHSGTEKKL